MLLCQTAHNFFATNLPRLAGNHLEIGVYEGDSLRILATAIPHKQFIGVDPFLEDGWTAVGTGNERGSHNSKQEMVTDANIYGIPNITLHKIPSSEFYNNLTDEEAEKLNISSVFIDGSHHYEDVKLDFELAKKVIGTKSGIIVIDDVCGIPDVLQAYREFVDNNMHIISAMAGLARGEILSEDRKPGWQVAVIFLNGGDITC